MELKDHRNFFIDIEKTLINWDSTVIGAEELVDSLENAGKNVYFHSDNTLISRKGYARKLTSLGIPAEEEQVITSGYVAAETLADENIHEAYVVGETGLIEELEQRQVDVSEDADTAVIGLDRQFSYRKLSRLKEIIESGGKVYVCSTEKSFRTSEREVPHQGPVNAAVREFGEVEMAGKPGENFREVLGDYFDFFPRKSVFIGDRLQDIETGNRLGMTTAAVMSGGVNKKELADAEDIQKPDYGISSLHKLRRRII